ncbi:MAG: hypothetical protein CMM55_15840 [Rhodospirillaceae bacterium]|jgi:taurine dioxygenase|nr:hypothetical protein [Rhodospirillaceae bacterium]
MQGNSSVKVTTIVDGFVGRISGLDLSAGADSKIAAFLTRTHNDFPVLAIEGQSLDADGLKTFGRIFGDFEIDHHVTQFAVEDHPELVYMTNRKKDGKADPASAERGAAWHADSTFKANPCAHTVMYAMKMPSRGAGTLFADMYRAYETLPQDLKDVIDGREGKHKFSAGPAEGGVIPMTEEQDDMHPPVIHSMVRSHPVTGRKALYVNPLHVYGIAGMPQEEAAPLLDRIFSHALKSEFQYCYSYRVGDLVIWDQRCTWHKAEAAYSMDEVRLLMRAKISAAA